MRVHQGKRARPGKKGSKYLEIDCRLNNVKSAVVVEQ